MTKVKTVKIDGEDIYIFNSVLYILEASAGWSLILDMIVTEITQERYKKEENLILEIELEDGRVFNSIMHIQPIPGGLPQLSLYTYIDDANEYPDVMIVNENETSFPRIDQDLTIEEIRKVEMPQVKVKLNLTLPIDQAEWIAGKKKKELDQILRTAIYDFWGKSE
ncbi:hypothetical protein [Peribacillus kribbensis]|uniref:hypothetical protein n=1 Tax=Peribacillus kribbensis TaxID=356658 RepID=UPI0003F76B24|nr:hypothetical protein [Peribacillus kribbensis]